MSRIALLLLLTLTAAAQTEVTLTLAGKDGRTQLHQGEAIEIQLKFQTSVPGKYAVWPRQTYRVARKAEYDTFTAEPSPGAVDPLADCPAQISGEAVVGQIPVPTPLDAAGVAVTLTLNKWIAFRKPGHYRVSVETTRLVTRAAQMFDCP